MDIRTTGISPATLDILAQFLVPYHPRLAWITTEKGDPVMAGPGCEKRSTDELQRVWSKHKTQFGLRPDAQKFIGSEVVMDLGPELPGLFSCRKIQIQHQNFILIYEVNPPSDLQLSAEQIVAEEFGIYSWQFHLDTNRFYFSPEAGRRFFGLENGQLDYATFYSSLSPESLQRFSEAMESAINFGKGFRIEVMLEQTSGFEWISISCRPTTDAAQSHWLTGLVKSVSEVRQEATRKHELDQWLQVGLARFEVKNEEGAILAEWGRNLTGRNIRIEPGRRISTVYDFRNRPRFTITAETGIPGIESSANHPTQAPGPSQKPKPETTPGEPENEILPIDKLNKDEKCVALTQWLGQSLDVQVSALGIFDGSRFEWKAWWKSPNRFALPVKKYSGEWLPELDWLVDVENDNQKFSDRYWWPQDMLPFSISDAFGEGWMVLAEPISSKETSVFAVRTADPQGIMEKTQHVLKSLDLLRDIPTNSAPDSVESLKEELARKDLLIKEMNHRAKNNLALAASFVKMQAGYAEDELATGILKQTQKRLETLATIHEMMYLSPDVQGTVNIKEYLQQLTEGLMNGFGNPNVTLEFRADSAQIDMKIANTIGLLVNELISNAFKYAFTPEKPGLLRIDFLDKGEHFKLRVSDNGPGLEAETHNSGSLGSVLIQEFVKQLQGTMEVVSGPGTAYLISLKKSIIGA